MAFLGRHYSSSVKAAGVLGAFILLVALGCHILCLATPFFFTLTDKHAREVLQMYIPRLPNNLTFGINYGLWMICVDGGPSTFQNMCFRITSSSSIDEVQLPEWLVAPRVLSILGVLLTAAAVLSLIAFLLTKMEKLPHFFLASAAVTSIVGGIIILSSDIAFSAEKTISFYGYKPKDSYLFPAIINKDQEAYFIQQYDNRFISGWSFILDLISGALCIVVGPIFVFIAIRLQWEEELRGMQRRLDKHPSFSPEDTKTTVL